VNSLIGEEVAPMGVVPTTATVNVLAYGRVRGGRVIYRDDRVRELAWDEVPAVLRGLDAAEVRAIRLVEVLYPAEELLRVSIVDTPGLNSILPEHEAVAREFITQADAVIWLFSTGQAGKASERDALTAIRAAGKECLGVLNKIDRASAEERTQLVEHLRGELGELVVDVVPYSAREALAARKASPGTSPGTSPSPPADDTSNRSALVRALEERFYSRARALKRAQAQTRLGAVLRAARADVATRQAELAADTERLHSARRNARAEVLVLERELVPAELRALEVAVGRAFRAAAREVLDFVRPRRWALGEHNADPADRDFLIDLLEDTLGEALVAARGRVLAGLWRLFDAAGPLGDGRARDAAARLLDARVLDRFRAFLRGTLRGGRVDDFFSRTLPRLELSEDNITSALARDAGELLGELGAPLRELCVDLGHELDSRAELALATCDLGRLDLDERLAAPLDAAIAALAQSPS